MSQRIAHLELRSPDLKQAETFYAKLFGWKLTVFDGQVRYVLFDDSDGPAGGMMQEAEGHAPHWVPYVSVPDLNACIVQAQSLGAKLVMGPEEVPGTGMICVFEDPSGSPIGVIEPVKETNK
jgi:predicted enzyme related to lactoylglutathione lyase